MCSMYKYRCATYAFALESTGMPDSIAYSLQSSIHTTQFYQLDLISTAPTPSCGMVGHMVF